MAAEHRVQCMPIVNSVLGYTRVWRFCPKYIITLVQPCIGTANSGTCSHIGYLMILWDTQFCGIRANKKAIMPIGLSVYSAYVYSTFNVYRRITQTKIFRPTKTIGYHYCYHTTVMHCLLYLNGQLSGLKRKSPKSFRGNRWGCWSDLA